MTEHLKQNTAEYKTMSKTIASLAFAGLACVGGCAMAPKYERPAAPMPAQLPGGEGNAIAADLPWREFVREPKLQQVIAQALTNNRNLRQAALRIESARAQYRIQRAQALPSIDAVAAANVARTIVGDDNATATVESYSATVGLATWEIDVFGRLRSLSDARLQQYFSTIEAAKATRVSLVAELANAYIALAADRALLQIATDTMDNSKRIMELTEKLVGGGTSNRGDYWQAATVYQQARADVALFTAQIAQDRNALELLAGSPIADDLLPGALPDQLDWFADVPVGLSSTVLLDRPDVRAAEHDLIAANANIGEARARFFPSLTLTASGGIASTALSALFSGPAAVFTLAPALAVPLFRGGANRANLAFSEAQKQLFVASYELAIQTAFREVADALATRGTIAERLAAQTALNEAATKGFELAQARYRAGVDTFLTTLVSQRALYQAQNALVATRTATLGSRITLYRVLGGGLK